MTAATTSTDTLDVAALRAHFPQLADRTAYFDGPGGTQTPDVVADAVRDALLAPLSNRGTVNQAARNADAIVRAGRAALGDLLGVPADTVVLGRSATELTFQLARTLSRGWGPGDEVVVTRLDHDANIRPWVLAAEAVGATVRWARFDAGHRRARPRRGRRRRRPPDPPGRRDRGVEPHRHPPGPARGRRRRPRGRGAGARRRRPPRGARRGRRRRPRGRHVRLLAVQVPGPAPRRAHRPGRPARASSARTSCCPSSDAVPERYELGTLPYELIAGTTAAIDLLASLAPAGTDGDRRARLLAAMAVLERARGPAARADRGRPARPGADGVVARRVTAPRRCSPPRRTARPPSSCTPWPRPGVNAPAGHFYALEASRWLGLGDEGGLRIGVAPYTDDEDVDRLLAALAAALGR